MSIEAEVTVTLAEACVSDEYGVELAVWKRHINLSPDEATQLADELVKAAAEARHAFAEDFPVVDEQHGLRAVEHGFDQKSTILAVNPECREGKHANCSGEALSEDDEVVHCVCLCHIGQEATA
jgi:hypothetical protein